MASNTEIYVTPEGIEYKRPKYWVAKNGSESRGKLNTSGNVQQAELEIELSTLPNGTPNYNVDRDNDGTLDGYLSNEIYIPANASIISATAFVREAAAGGTSFDVGTFRFDGTAVDADGLMDDVLLAEVDSVGKRVVGSGALTVPATSSVGTSPVTIGLTATGAFTAGKVQIVVEYSLN